MYEVEPEEASYRSFLKELVQGGDINHPVAEGITKQVIERGEGSLSSAQRAVFTAQVQNKFPRLICHLDGEDVEWDLTYEQLGDPEPTCSHCQYRLDQLEHE